MTEANTISTPMGRVSDPETVGWLPADTEARVVDPESGREVAQGEPGELWIRGPQIMDGYRDDLTATAAAITADGWLRTGDLVTFRDDGQLLQDRIKELIEVDGYPVAPAELELVLRKHPAVRDVGVVGRPDTGGHGEVPVAHVLPSGSPTAAELIWFVDARVAPHKRLHAVRFVDELPRLPSGKLQRRKLAERERARPRTAQW